MQSIGLAPAGVVAMQESTAQPAVPWVGNYVPAECNGRGHDHQEQHLQQQQQQLGSRRRGPPVQRAVLQLPTGPFLRVLELLSAQDRACSGRLACRDAWRHQSGVHHRTAHLSQPLPPHAVPWFEQYGPEALKQLAFEEKLTRPMAAAAASGSEANLAAVWGVVRQGLHPQLLRDRCYYNLGAGANSPGAVLVQKGHAHLLPWLLNSGCPVDAEYTFLVAAQFCDLAGLRAVWQLMQPRLARFRDLHSDALVWATGSPTAEGAIAKMEWLLQQHGDGGAVARLSSIAAAAAAGTGDLVLLRWMLQRGCDFSAYGNELDGSGRVLPTAMRHAGLEVVEWLVREACCRLPDPAPAPDAAGLPAAAAAAAAADEESNDDSAVLGVEEDYKVSLASAAVASGSTAKLQWLQGRGLLQSLQPAAMQDLLSEAAAEGQAESLRYLHLECGVGLSDRVAYSAVRSGNVATAAWVLQQEGRGVFAHHSALWVTASGSGSVDMVRWLIEEGMAGALGHLDAVTLLVKAWPSETQQQRASLLPAVQLAVQTLGGGPSSSGGGGGSGGGDGSSGVRGDGDDGRSAPGATPGMEQPCQELLVAAAQRGNLPLLAYLHSQLQLQGSPLGPEVLLQAVRSGCEALVEWLLRHGCALPEDIVALLLEPATRGDLATLRCLRRMGVPWPRGLLPEAVRRQCPLPMLRWLVSEGVPVDVAAVDDALLQKAGLDYRRSVELWLEQVVREADDVISMGAVVGRRW